MPNNLASPIIQPDAGSKLERLLAFNPSTVSEESVRHGNKKETSLLDATRELKARSGSRKLIYDTLPAFIKRLLPSVTTSVQFYAYGSQEKENRLNCHTCGLVGVQNINRSVSSMA